MAKVDIVTYQEKNGQSQLPEWFNEQSDKVKVKLQVRLRELANKGPHARRPLCAPLGQGVYEARADSQNLHYRILYGFPGGGKAMLSHGFIKRGKVPPKEIKKARLNLNNYKRNPELHTYPWEL